MADAGLHSACNYVSAINVPLLYSGYISYVPPNCASQLITMGPKTRSTIIVSLAGFADGFRDTNRG